MPTEAECAALIERMLVSSLFRKGGKSSGLLRYFFDNRQSMLSADQILEDFLGMSVVKHDSGHARSAVQSLKKSIEKYYEAASDERIRCEILDARTHGGYQLHFHEATETESATRLFWKAHTEIPENTIIVTGWRLFFKDEQRNAIIRFYGLSVGDKLRYPAEDIKVPGAGKAHAKLKALPNYYLSVSDVQAYDIFLRWFHGQTKNFLIRRVTCRDISDSEIQRRSPILIGRPWSNSFMDSFLRSPQGEALAYRLEPTGGTVRIIGITPKERKQLSAFRILRNGVLQAKQHGKVVFGIFARMKNPSGYGNVSLIMCDLEPRVIPAIVEVMTNEIDAAAILSEMGHPMNKPLPACFEMLFSLSVSPGGLEILGVPNFLCWRAHRS